MPLFLSPSGSSCCNSCAPPICIVSDNARTHRKRKLPSSFRDSHLPWAVQDLFQYEPAITVDNARTHYSNVFMTVRPLTINTTATKRTACEINGKALSQETATFWKTNDSSLLRQPKRAILRGQRVVSKVGVLSNSTTMATSTSLQTWAYSLDHSSSRMSVNLSTSLSRQNKAYSMKLLEQVLHDLDEVFGHI